VLIDKKGIILKGAGIDKTNIIDATGTDWGEHVLVINGVQENPSGLPR